MLIDVIMNNYINPSEIKKILCIKPRGIGDIILSTIVLENLHSHFPNATIDYLTEEFAKDAVITHPLVNNVLTFVKNDSLISIVRKIRREKYDLVLDFYTNPRTAQITFLSGAMFRIGYSYTGRKYAYNILAESGRGENHSAEHNLELLAAIGVPTKSKSVKYYLSKEAENFANLFINNIIKSKYLIGIIPSGGWDSKRCPKERWFEILKSFSQKIDCSFMLLWGPEDIEDVNYLNSSLPDFTILAPETTIIQMAGLISKCNLIIANDSGPMHLAAALGIPTLGLFGPTDPKKHGPYTTKGDFVIKDDLHCIKCNKLKCPYNKECFNEISIEQIISKSIRLLNSDA